MKPILHLLLGGVLLGGLAASAAAGQDGDSAGASDAEAGSRGPVFASAEALLDALETADREIESFQAEIVYDRQFMLQGDRHIRGGDLYFEVEPRRGEPRPVRTFAVHFEWLLLDGAKRNDRQAWIFDGEWLVEKRFADRQYVARQIAPPGERIDPLRLGEGPLPMPIGQRKADILARYEAEVLPAHAGFDAEQRDHAGYMSAVEGATQLRLTPLPHREAQDDFRSIRLWYRHDEGGRLLPVLSRTVDRKGDESFVLLADVRVNRPIPGSVVDISPPPVEEGWEVQYETYRPQRERGGAGGDDGSQKTQGE